MKKMAHIESTARLKRKPHVKKLIEKARANVKVTGVPADTAPFSAAPKIETQIFKKLRKAK